jgi:riboflavin kinase / FMN adenylyltransferase
VSAGGTPDPGAAPMTVVHGLDGLDRSLGRLFVVIGVFDGLHRGHQYLLEHLVQEARRLGARPAVLTFDHHPDEILTGEAPPLLCDPDERLERLEAAGVAVTIVQTFDVALRETPYDAFVGRIAEGVELAGFLMTPESAFGFERRGTPETVAALGRDLGYEVVTVPPFTLDGAAVTSSAIRAAIARGDLAGAARLLGRKVSIVGTVERPLREMTPLRFALPVALPPAGRYEAAVRTHGGGIRHRELAIDGDGVSIVPAIPVTTGARLAVDLLRPAPG